MTKLEIMGKNSAEAAYKIGAMLTPEKNRALTLAAEALIKNTDNIIAANDMDIASAVENGLKASLIDRLKLDEGRIKAMADGLLQVASLPDPVGEIVEGKTLPNGLIMYKKRVPMGVIGIIYEARPNVTADAFGLCFKAGNAVILRGGKEAIHSNKTIIDIIRKALSENGFCEDAVQLIEDTDRKTAEEMMRLNGYIDVLIPRGGAGLIRSVVENSTVPVIETGTGNCHVYVDKAADFDKAVKIVINAKTQRPGVCNACETLLVHKDIADKFLPLMCGALKDKGVQIRGDERVNSLISYSVKAEQSDWGTEFLDYIISARVVENEEEAINHIRKYGTKHSECIVTEDYGAAQMFLDRVDAAAVYANASTRFTDGGEFGLGAEIGISTQKLHARGPMGLKELTTTKYVIYGNGQIR